MDHVKNAQSCVNCVNTHCGTYGGTYENRTSVSTGLQDPKSLILIWDTGVSYGLTPFCSDLIDYVKCENPVRDVTKVNTVIGIGTTLHKFTDIQWKPGIFTLCLVSLTRDRCSSVLSSNIPPDAWWILRSP